MIYIENDQKIERTEDRATRTLIFQRVRILEF